MTHEGPDRDNHGQTGKTGEGEEGSEASELKVNYLQTRLHRVASLFRANAKYIYKYTNKKQNRRGISGEVRRSLYIFPNCISLFQRYFNMYANLFCYTASLS